MVWLPEEKQYITKEIINRNGFLEIQINIAYLVLIYILYICGLLVDVGWIHREKYIGKYVGPLADIGRGLIQCVIRTLTRIVHFIIYFIWRILDKSFSLSYLIQHAWAMDLISIVIFTQAASDIDFFHADHSFIIKIFQLYVCQEQAYMRSRS